MSLQNPIDCLSGRSFTLITLGCFRNEVESDLARSVLAGLGMRETTSIESSDVILVMTCGFIREACDEGIDTILELDELAGSGEDRPPIIALGCMAQRYGEDLAEQMPELAAVLGAGWSADLERTILEAIGGKGRAVAQSGPAQAEITRTVDSSENSTLYLRVADGCDRACGFCTIPSIRGPFVSRRPDVVLEEVARLAAGRDREVILLAQDLTSYGCDLDGKSDLPRLIRRIAAVPHVHWLRLLYLQPEGVTNRLLEEVAANERVCKYFDIPFQHASRAVLGRMGRPGSGEEYLELVAGIRRMMPDAAVRSTVMVGYPGEGERDFDELVGFIKEARFDWLGAFVFSPEEGTAAGGLDGAVPVDEALSRYNKVVELQDAIEAENLERFLGRELEVVVDELCEIEPYDLVGRSCREAPVVDGMIYLRRVGRDGTAGPGDFRVARITGHEGLDLVGEI